MTFVIVPSSTLIYSTVANNEMTNASSLQNLVKNVGCAVGTSSVGVLVSRYSQIHQSYLVHNLGDHNNIFIQKLNTLTQAFMQQGADIYLAQAKANAMLYKQLLQ